MSFGFWSKLRSREPERYLIPSSLSVSSGTAALFHNHIVNADAVELVEPDYLRQSQRLHSG
jgi:hypothetical protein